MLGWDWIARQVVLRNVDVPVLHSIFALPCKFAPGDGGKGWRQCLSILLLFPEQLVAVTYSVFLSLVLWAEYFLLFWPSLSFQKVPVLLISESWVYVWLWQPGRGDSILSNYFTPLGKTSNSFGTGEFPVLHREIEMYYKWMFCFVLFFPSPGCNWPSSLTSC